MTEMKNAVESFSSRIDEAEKSVDSKTGYLNIYSQSRKQNEKEWRNLKGFME